jgi:phosphoglycerol geranylgeranyltransferase
MSLSGVTNSKLMIYNNILNKQKKKKQFFLLIDPDRYNNTTLKETIRVANNFSIDLILVGGSLVSRSVSPLIDIIKNNTDIPVVLFPGSLLQITDNADGILLLSLISGRNPEFLIGNHVIASPVLKRSNLEIISTGYILIDNGKTPSVEYMSNTTPIPSDKIDIAVATALAGEMLGLKLIYLEGGSGAKQPVKGTMIEAVKQNVTIPLIVGGGIKNEYDAANVYKAGADIIVVGNAIESKLKMLEKIATLRDRI